MYIKLRKNQRAKKTDRGKYAAFSGAKKGCHDIGYRQPDHKGNNPFDITISQESLFPFLRFILTVFIMPHWNPLRLKIFIL